MGLENKLDSVKGFIGIATISYIGVQGLQYIIPVINNTDITIYNHAFSMFSGMGLAAAYCLGKEKNKTYK